MNKMNYFQAVGEAVGTDRRVKLEDGEWLYVNMKNGEIVLTDVYSETAWLIEDDDVFSPSADQKLFKAWTVEPRKATKIFLNITPTGPRNCRLDFEWQKDGNKRSLTSFAPHELFIDGTSQKFQLVPVREEDNAV